MKRGRQIVVVGGGIIGAAVFMKLSEQYGADVLLIEQGRPAAGASAFSGGILRAFHLDSAMTNEAISGIRFYEDLARRRGEELRIERTGFLTLVGESSRSAARAQYERCAATINMRWLSAAEAGRMLGSALDTGVVGAVYEPDAGYVDVPALVSLMLRCGTEHGGRILSGVTLDGIVAHAGAVARVTTSDGAHDCDTVVMCTGAWTPTLAARLGVALPEPLRSKAIQVNRIQPRRSCTRMPGFLDLDTGVYGRPDRPGMLIGCPVDSWDIDPDLVEPPMVAQYQEVLRRGTARFRWLDSSCVLGGSRRQDAYTGSGAGSIAWSPSMRGLLFATGYSGSGVKVAPVAAERVIEQLRAAAPPARAAAALEHAHD